MTASTSRVPVRTASVLRTRRRPRQAPRLLDGRGGLLVVITSNAPTRCSRCSTTIRHPKPDLEARGPRGGQLNLPSQAHMVGRRGRRRRRCRTIPRTRLLSAMRAGAAAELPGDVEVIERPHRPGRRRFRRSGSLLVGPGPLDLGRRQRHRRSRYLGRSGRARPPVQAWPPAPPTKSEPTGMASCRIGLRSCASVLACSATPSDTLRGMRLARPRGTPHA